MSGKPWLGKIALVLALFVGIDQMVRWGIASSLRRDTVFFEAIVAEADLSRYTVAQSLQRTGQALYQDCRWHQVYLIYRAKTCFSLNKDGGLFSVQDEAGQTHRELALYYWPPRSLIGSLISDAWLEEIGHHHEIVLFVSEGRNLVKWAR